MVLQLTDVPQSWILMVSHLTYVRGRVCESWQVGNINGGLKALKKVTKINNIDFCCSLTHFLKYTVLNICT
jgi:hypothetical protein